MTALDAAAESAHGSAPYGEGDLPLPLAQARTSQEHLRELLVHHSGSTFSRWLGIFDSLVGGSTEYDPERVQLSGKGSAEPHYQLAVGLSRYSGELDHSSLEDVFFEANAGGGRRVRLRSDGTMYNPMTTGTQDGRRTRKMLVESRDLSEFGVELYDLLFPEVTSDD